MKSNNNLFFNSKKALSSIGRLAEFLLVAVTIVLLIYLSISYLSDTTSGGLSDFKLKTIIEKCEISESNCNVISCSEGTNNKCDDIEKSTWVSFENYYKKCKKEISLSNEDYKKLNCGVLFEKIKNIYSNSSENIYITNYTPLTNEELKNLEQNLGKDFILKIDSISNVLGTKSEYLLAVIHFETGGSFDPCVQNNIGATGLIQFTKTTAKNLGTSTDKLCKMSRFEQLDYVEKYLINYKGKVSTLHDLYLAVFLPSVLGNDLGDVIDSKYYDENKGLDIDKNGEITIAEISSITIKIYNEYYS
jgi:hypothetical protein